MSALEIHLAHVGGSPGCTFGSSCSDTLPEVQAVATSERQLELCAACLLRPRHRAAAQGGNPNWTAPGAAVRGSRSRSSCRYALQPQPRWVWRCGCCLAAPLGMRMHCQEARRKHTAAGSICEAPRVARQNGHVRSSFPVPGMWHHLGKHRKAPPFVYTVCVCNVATSMYSATPRAAQTVTWPLARLRGHSALSHVALRGSKAAPSYEQSDRANEVYLTAD